jgi:hypothetical protein
MLYVLNFLPTGKSEEPQMQNLKILAVTLWALAYTNSSLANAPDQNLNALLEKIEALQRQQTETQRQIDELRNHVAVLQKQQAGSIATESSQGRPMAQVTERGNNKALLDSIHASDSMSSTAGVSEIALDTLHSHHEDSVPIRFGANFDLLAASRNTGPVEQRRQLSLREVELSLEAQISPSLYGIIFLTLPDGGAMSVEEAAVMADLPWGVRLKAGKYRNEFGLLNTIHEPERPQISLPLPVVEFFGEEQLREPAMMLGRAFNLGKGQRAGLSLAVLNANNEVAFNNAQSRDKAYSGKLYYGLESARAAYQLGASALTGKNNAAGTLATSAQALDFRIMIDPGYNQRYDYPARFSLLGELLFNQREIASGSINRARGFWGVADYQMTQGHHIGLGAEYSQGLLDRSQISKAYSAHYSWYYSPHSRVQLQARRLSTAEGIRGMELMLQWNVVLGPHSEKPFLNILSVDK